MLVASAVNSWWLGCGLLGIPSALYTAAQCCCVYFTSLCRLGHRHAFASHRDLPVHSGIAHLSLHRAPFAIVRRIGAVVVEALQSVLWRAFSHVCVESSKVISPAITYRNAARSIVPIIRPSGIVASAAHVDPYAELSRGSHSVRRDGYLLGRTHVDESCASTSPRLASPQVGRWDEALSPAVADAPYLSPDALAIERGPHTESLTLGHADEIAWKCNPCQQECARARHS